ncbi:N-formylglutamate amidohydrolase [Mangrovicoccus sp. HB161399]|uniref:N-formylglutamate amidohydrolase n=1 Tax=Mangrovicoccus sp. HB161399 TaxID=2720392 RepID=UPI001554A97C|nr:N-formylglutamate amidohydrolase [Mangrovicoccus sp. HB161399]
MARAFEVTGAERSGTWVVSCDHATNIVPASVNGGDLGLPPRDMERHIAYDVGALGVALALGEALEAPVAASRFSRLVIDPNRGEDDPTLLMRIYDGSIIPANRHADSSETARRLDAFYRPYHGALAELMSARADPVLVSVHSFTRQLAGRPPRPWQVGILSAADRRLSEAFIAALSAPDFADWVEEVSGAPLEIGDNQPYSGHLPGDAVDRHALRQGHLNTLIEIRNDLIATPAQQAAWGARLAPLLRRALHDAREARDPLS